MNETAVVSKTEEDLPKLPEGGWKFPQRSITLRLKPEEEIPVAPIPSEREARLKEKYGIEPQTGLRERGVRFDYEDGPAWAVEAYIPISKEFRNTLKYRFNVKIVIPENITGITYLDLSPQESTFPVQKRNITTDWKTKTRLGADITGAGRILDRLRRASMPDSLSDFFGFLVYANIYLTPDQRKANAFGDILENIFGEKREMRERFNEILKEAKGNDLVVVHGHGGGDPHTMGEQYPDTVMSGDYVAQRLGNRVPTEDIVKMYNEPKTFAAIIFHACNMNRAEIQVKDVPIIHPKGPSMLRDSPFPWQKNQAFIKESEKK